MDYNTQGAEKTIENFKICYIKIIQLLGHVMRATPISVLSIGRLEGWLQWRTKKLCTSCLMFSVVNL